MGSKAISRTSQAVGGSTRFLNRTGYSPEAVSHIRRYITYLLLVLFFTRRAQALELLGEGEESTATGEDQSRMSTPGLTTVIVPPAPRSEVLTAAQQKKNRDREYQRKKRAEKRRSTATPASDEESVSGRKPTKRARLADDD